MTTKRKNGLRFIIVSTLVILYQIIFGVVCNYKYEQTISSDWTLAEKASTIKQKSDYIDKFIVDLQNSNLSGKYDAIWLQTPNNSFDKNFEAIKSLQSRLHDIQNMDITSFPYQSAIQQITAQEQGEARDMLSVFKGVWIKDNYFILWDWICATTAVFFSILLIIGVCLVINWDH